VSRWVGFRGTLRPHVHPDVLGYLPEFDILEEILPVTKRIHEYLPFYHSVWSHCWYTLGRNDSRTYLLNTGLNWPGLWGFLHIAMSAV
jgi:hypothetical protein